MTNSIFIPQKIKVGFQEREDTYTKKLAYVIYFDEKGKLRKEASWESWRNKHIEPVEYDNAPLEGFVLNKKVGGYAGDWRNFRQAYVRVYDPRGFEFEITVPNLIYILEHTSSIKGKGLEGEFVYGWSGTDLVLIPTCSPDYVSLTALNKKRFEKNFVKAKDLKIGAEYLTKSNIHLLYMGRFNAFESGYLFDGQWFATYHAMAHYANKMGKELVCYNHYPSYQSKYTYEVGNAGPHHFFYDFNYGFIHTKSISGLLIDTISESPTEMYAELFERLEHETSYSPYDATKDVQRHATFEEFAKSVDRPGTQTRSVIIYDSPMKIELYKKDRESDDSMYHLRFIDGNNIKLYFPNAEVANFRYAQYVVVSLKEIYDIFPILITDQYLQNGKFYRSVW